MNTVNIPISEFYRLWFRVDDGFYSNGTLQGEVYYENSEYVVLKIKTSR